MLPVNCPVATSRNKIVKIIIASLQVNYVYKLLGVDPLLDGEGCNGAEGSCCDNLNQPWFCKELAEPTEDDLEMRICTDLDNGMNDEDVAIELLDLFVQ